MRENENVRGGKDTNKSNQIAEDGKALQKSLIRWIAEVSVCLYPEGHWNPNQIEIYERNDVCLGQYIVLIVVVIAFMANVVVVAAVYFNFSCCFPLIYAAVYLQASPSTLYTCQPLTALDHQQQQRQQQA